MGRRSLKQERRAQILDAFERCVADHGLAGATLDRVADYAGLGRPAIRHNVGNRDALIDAALDRIADRHRQGFASLVDELPSRSGKKPARVDALLRYLFIGAFSGPVDAEDAILDELFAVRHRDRRVAKLLAASYQELQRTITRELLAEHTQLTKPRASAAAYQLMTLAYGHSTLHGLGLGKQDGERLLQCARSLVANAIQQP